MNDPRALAELMDKYQVDCINATPSRLLQYLDYAPFREALSRCKIVMSGGEGYPMVLRDRIRACAPDTEIDIDELRSELKKHLTPYMVPKAFLQMPALPQTANGKTDLKALPEPVPVSLGSFVPPANEREAFFCETFQKVLNLEKVGATDDFFDIGGTSFVVTSIVLAAEEKGYKLTYGDVFKYTTPRALAGLFDSEDETTKSDSSLSSRLHSGSCPSIFFFWGSVYCLRSFFQAMERFLTQRFTGTTGNGRFPASSLSAR